MIFIVLQILLPSKVIMLMMDRGHSFLFINILVVLGQSVVGGLITWSLFSEDGQIVGCKNVHGNHLVNKYSFQ